MRIVTFATSCALLAACYSKPPNLTGAGGDGGIDASVDAAIDAVIDAPIDAPPIVPAAPARISAGIAHACRIDAQTRLICWGDGLHGQLGNQSVAATGDPVLAFAGAMEAGWSTVAAGSEHTCGIRSGAVYCWGRNDAGQAVPGAGLSDVTIAQVAVPGTAVKVYAGKLMSCAINTLGRAYCWGQLSMGAIEGAPADFAISGVSVLEIAGSTGSTWTEIAITSDHACAISAVPVGVPHCWGKNEAFQLGRAFIDKRFDNLQPIQFAEAPFTSISVARHASCGIAAGILRCWGSTAAGHLGNNTGNHEDLLVDDTRIYVRVALGIDHVCAIDAAGQVFCYGDNRDGAIGGDTFSSQRTIGPVVPTHHASELAAGESFTCSLAADGVTTSCWGANRKGELGNRQIARHTTPVRALLPTGMVHQIVAGDHHMCALIGSTKTTYCWGLNDKRQIDGVVTEIAHATPQPGPASAFDRLASGGVHTCGMPIAGDSVTCWGDNSSFQLGSAVQSAGKSVVMAPAVLEPWTYVAAGSTATCAISDGKLYCWGRVPGNLNNPSATMTPFGRFGATASWDWKTISIGSGFAVGVVFDAVLSRYHLASFGTRCPAGQVNDPMTDLAVPDETMSGFTFTAMPRVAAAQNAGKHTCVHHSSGGNRVTCFGDPNGMAAGATHPSCATVSPFDAVFTDPAAVPPTAWSAFDGTLAELVTGNDHSCALNSGGEAYCWGANSNLELGPLSSSGVPARVDARLFVELATGFSHTCGITADRMDVYCWGANQYGQVGDGSRYHASPVTAGVFP